MWSPRPILYILFILSAPVFLTAQSRDEAGRRRRPCAAKRLAAAEPNWDWVSWMTLHACGAADAARRHPRRQRALPTMVCGLRHYTLPYNGIPTPSP
jgi:hypothetical protein